MDEKASNAMLVAIVAVVAIVGLIMLYSGNEGGSPVSGQATITCYDSDGNNPNAFGFVQAPPGSPAVPDVCVDSTTVDEKYCLGGRLTSTRTTCGAGLQCITQLYTLRDVSVTSGRCAIPSAPEICDNLDNDYNGVVDNGCDDDNDNRCDSGIAKAVGVTVTTCTATPAASARGDDCNDNNPNIRPGAAEICGNGVDEDCSGVDLACPLPPLPGAPETICDNIDNDADGTVDDGCDDDNDNYCDAAIRVIGYPTTCSSGGEDCNDNNIAIHPYANDNSCDGVDQNCDGGDGIANNDWCDGLDNNCDGGVDLLGGLSSCPTCTDGDGGNNPSMGSFASETWPAYPVRDRDLYDFCSNSSIILNESVCVPHYGELGSVVGTVSVDCVASGRRCVSAGSGAYCG